MIANCWHLLLRPRAKIVLAFLAGIGAQIHLYGKIRPRFMSRLS